MKSIKVWLARDKAYKGQYAVISKGQPWLNVAIGSFRSCGGSSIHSSVFRGLGLKPGQCVRATISVEGE